MMTKENETFAEVAKSIEDELPSEPVVATQGTANSTAAPAPTAAPVPEGAAPPPPTKAGKKAGKTKAGGYQIQYSTGMKLIAFFTFLCMAVVASLAVVSIGVMLQNDFYTQTEQEIKEEYFAQIAGAEVRDILAAMLKADSAVLDDLARTQNVSVQLVTASGEVLQSSGTAGAEAWELAYQNLANYVSTASITDQALKAAMQDSSTTLLVSFTPSNGWSTDLDVANQLISHGYANRYYVILNLVLSVLLGLFCFFYLFRAIGHTPRGQAVVLSDWTNIPFDLFTILTALCLLLPTVGGVALIEQSNRLEWWQFAAAMGGIGLLFVAIALLFLLNCAVRCKAGDIWRNTLVYKLCAVLWHAFAKLMRRAAKGCGYFFAQLPFIWKGVVIFPAMVVLNLLLLWLCVDVLDGNGVFYIAFTVVQGAVVVGAYLYCLIALNRLAQGGKALAAGDLDYQVDTQNLCFELKEHAENINRMGGCLTEAVNDQLKSERMKTELITNVSHDIKTPLTSIINYADLLSKEETDNAKIAEYTEVIARQSKRLKRLIEDLTEASKASTGSLEVDLIPCEVGVLLSQTVGEYQQRLQEHALTLVAKQPEEPISIMADGRHLWRVFDNLLENIYKYAQSGTRVYLSLEKQNDSAVITFKNISEYPLDISAEELMERFVRGDASRHNEGNGLGLSIAQSLVELQGGTMALAIDGDLFKVELRFGLLNEAALEKV